MISRTYNFSHQVGIDGERLKDHIVVKDCSLVLKDGLATVLDSKGRLMGEMRFHDVSIAAMGIFIKGVESHGTARRYAEYWLEYPEFKPDENQRLSATVALKEREAKALDDLCKKQGLTRQQLMMQALRAYQVQVLKDHGEWKEPPRGGCMGDD